MRAFVAGPEDLRLLLGWIIATAVTTIAWSFFVGRYWVLLADLIVLSSVVAYSEAATHVREYWSSFHPRIVSLTVALCVMVTLGLVGAGVALVKFGLF